jgi:hypothetical protein
MLQFSSQESLGLSQNIWSCPGQQRDWRRPGQSPGFSLIAFDRHVPPDCCASARQSNLSRSLGLMPTAGGALSDPDKTWQISSDLVGQNTAVDLHCSKLTRQSASGGVMEIAISNNASPIFTEVKVEDVQCCTPSTLPRQSYHYVRFMLPAEARTCTSIDQTRRMWLS